MSFGGAVNVPTIDELAEIAKEKGFHCTTEELETYAKFLHGTRHSYEKLAKMPDVSLPVKHPRCPGYRPSESENKHNAWYYKCEIKGSENGKLKGKRIGIKDNIPVAGVPMMNGSMLLEGFTPAFDATVVTRILDEGGTIVGKTTCENLCFSGASYTTCFGPVRNPHNTLYSAGGSSSGSAVAVCLKETDMAVGGDQAGSVRMPSSACSIVGLKPTWSLVPYTGAIQIQSSVDHLGPMARTVYDCALLLEVIAGYDDGLDGRQSASMPKSQNYTQMLEEPVGDLRIGILDEGFTVCERSVVECVRHAIWKIKEGAAFESVENVSVPLHADSSSIVLPIMAEGAFFTSFEGAGCGIGMKGFAPTSLCDAIFRGIRSNPDGLPPPVKMKALWSTYISEHYGNHFYTKALCWAEKLREAYDEALTKCDVLIMPTVPKTPCPLPTKDTSTTDYLTNTMNSIGNTAPFNVTGHPAISIPAGLSTAENESKGLPIGLMIVGRHFEDGVVLQVAHAVEKVLDLSFKICS